MEKKGNTTKAENLRRDVWQAFVGEQMKPHIGSSHKSLPSSFLTILPFYFLDTLGLYI